MIVHVILKAGRRGKADIASILSGASLQFTILYQQAYVPYSHCNGWLLQKKCRAKNSPASAYKKFLYLDNEIYFLSFEKVG